MSEWQGFTTYYNGTLPGGTDLDWSPVAEMSDINVDRMALGAGLRFRSDSGLGLELTASVNDYNDDNPYLEDESGTFNRVMAVFSKSF